MIYIWYGGEFTINEIEYPNQQTTRVFNPKCVLNELTEPNLSLIYIMFQDG